MPIRNVPRSSRRYFLLNFDEQSKERQENGRYLSHEAVETLRDQPVTDIFLLSHGWKGDIPGAKDQYDLWIGEMASAAADVARMKEVRPGYTPLLVGLHWPSLPWGNETLDGEEAAGGAVPPTQSDPVEGWIRRWARRIADTPVAQAALRKIAGAAATQASPVKLPQDVREAYEALYHESGLSSEGGAGAPGHDHESFDPDQAYSFARLEGIAYDGSGLGPLEGPARQLSFWKMKNRAREFGEGGACEVLQRLNQAVQPGHDVRFHLMGHSFGCIVVSAMAAGPREPTTPIPPVHSLALIQGALSLWAYCQDVVPAPGKPGYFHRIIAEKRVAGPILTTQSEHDLALWKYYPWGAWRKGQLDYDIAGRKLPKYGAVGTFGARGPGITVHDRALGGVDEDYKFAAGIIYNLDCGHVIKKHDGAGGAHCDIAHPEVAHAVWEAARCGLPGA